MDQDVRVVVAIPAYTSVCTDMARMLAMLMFHVGHFPPPGLRWIAIETQSSSNLPELRHHLARNAMVEHNATHILWIDSDMTFPPDSLHRLLAHGKQIVGCNYARRQGTHFSTARDLERKPMDPNRTGLQQASVIGFGVLLTSVDVFAGEYEMPLFAHHDENGYCTEDVTFCNKVRARGHDVWVDHDLSRQVCHIGSATLSYYDLLQGHIEHQIEIDEAAESADEARHHETAEVACEMEAVR